MNESAQQVLFQYCQFKVRLLRHLKNLTVGYFLEWPMPMLAAKASGAYDDALGMKVNWVFFETGTAMSAAMASGDVHISVSQGVPPFVVAVSGGQDLQMRCGWQPRQRHLRRLH